MPNFPGVIKEKIELGQTEEKACEYIDIFMFGGDSVRVLFPPGKVRQCKGSNGNRNCIKISKVNQHKINYPIRS